MKKIFISAVVMSVVANCWALPPAFSQDIVLPKPGQRIGLSQAFTPMVLKGIKVDPNDPLKFNFFVDVGNEWPLKTQQGQRSLEAESQRLIKYFLASLTIPETDLWVNLSPYEKNRIAPTAFGKTEMGRDLLAQDYILKQITSSLMYPEGKLGKEFWQKIYAQAKTKYGTNNINVNAFNKVWIVPEKAVVYENNGTAFVVENRLKVMLEEDYLAMNKNNTIATDNKLRSIGQSQPGDMFHQNQQNVSPSKLPSILPLHSKASQGNPLKTHQVSSNITPQSHSSISQKAAELVTVPDIIQEIIIPVLTKEVNEGKNFAPLRQVFYSLILATWYKGKLKGSLLNQALSNQHKIKGFDVPANDKEKLYNQYLSAFKKGVYNYIKEETNPIDGKPIQRKYFSGGVNARINPAMATIKRAQLSARQISDLGKHLIAIQADAALITQQDAAMVPQNDPPNKVELEISDEQKEIEGYFQQLIDFYGEDIEPELYLQRQSNLEYYRGHLLIHLWKVRGRYKSLTLDDIPKIQQAMRQFKSALELRISDEHNLKYLLQQWLELFNQLENQINGAIAQIENNLRIQIEGVSNVTGASEFLEYNNAYNTLYRGFKIGDGLRIEYVSPSWEHKIIIGVLQSKSVDGLGRPSQWIEVTVLSDTGEELVLRFDRYGGTNRALQISRLESSRAMSSESLKPPSSQKQANAAMNSVPTTPDQVKEYVKQKPVLLYVEDDARLRDSFVGLVNALYPQINVLVAENGKEALDIIRQRSNDIGLIISDFDMPPHMNGNQLYKELRKINKKVPFVLYSGSSDKKDENIDSKEGRFNRSKIYNTGLELLKQFIFANAAMNSNLSKTVEQKRSPGGIDLNPAPMSFDVKSEGKSFYFNINHQHIDTAQVVGARFTIRSMTPVREISEVLK